MANPRTTRNIEASICDFLQEKFDNDWNNINVIIGFERARDIELPIIAIEANTTFYEDAEIGSNSFIRTCQVVIDVFAGSDGQRLDLKDYIIETLRKGLPFYEYEITQGNITEKTQLGRIRFTSMDDVPVNFQAEKSTLNQKDRFRHRINLDVNLGRVE